MAIQFPKGPFIGDTFPYDDMVYVWDGEKWTAQNDKAYWDKDGDELKPEDTGDDVNLGTGDLSANNGNFDGDLTVAGDIRASSLNGGQLAGFRNQIINGDFRVWQRGPSGSINGTAYRADRWQSSTSTNGQVQRQTAPNDLPFDFVCEFTANGDAMRQGIELNVNLAGNGQPGPYVPGSTWTLSVYANWDMSNITPVIAFRNTLSDATGQKVLCVPTPKYQAVGPAVEGYTRYSTTITVDAGVEPGTAPMLAIVLIPSGGIPDGSRITGCQFEPGPVATSFEHRPIATELALCQRYFFANDELIVATLPNTSSSSKTRSVSLLRPVPMRTTPSEVIPDPSSGTVKSAKPSPKIIRVAYTVNNANDQVGLAAGYTADAEL